MNRAEQDYLDKLYRDMKKMLLQYAKQHLNGLPLAEDAVQEVFVIAGLRIDAVMSSNNPKGWLVNTLKNVIRKVKVASAMQSQRLLAVDSEALPASRTSDLFESGDARWVSLFYSGLVAEEDFQIIKLIDVEGCSIREAARALSIGEEACKKRIQRARAKLRTALIKIS